MDSTASQFPSSDRGKRQLGFSGPPAPPSAVSRLGPQHYPDFCHEGQGAEWRREQASGGGAFTCKEKRSQEAETAASGRGCWQDE